MGIGRALRIRLFATAEDFQEVVPKLGRDRAVNFSDGVVEYDLIEFWNHPTFLEFAQISTR